MADRIDPEMIAALLARAPTSNIGLATGTEPPSGPIVEPYKPSTMDMIARLLLGKEPPARDSIGGGVSDLLLGTRGHGPTGPLPGGTSVADFTPLGPGAEFIDKSARGDIAGAMGSGITGAALTPGVGGPMVRGIMDAGSGAASRVAQMLMASPKTTAAGAGVAAATGGASEASPPASTPAPTQMRTLFPDDPQLVELRGKRANMAAPDPSKDAELARLTDVIKHYTGKIDSPADKKITTATRNAWIAAKAEAEKAYRDRLGVLEGNVRTDTLNLDKEIATRMGDLKRAHPTYDEANPWISQNPVMANLLLPALMGTLVKGGQAAAGRAFMKPWTAALNEGEAALAGGNMAGARASHAAADTFRKAEMPSSIKSEWPAVFAGVSGGEALALGPTIHNSQVAPPGSREREEALARRSDPLAMSMDMGRGLILGGLSGWTGGKVGKAADQYIPGSSSVPPSARTEALGARISAPRSPPKPADDVASSGRYDRILRALNADKPVPRNIPIVAQRLIEGEIKKAGATTSAEKIAVVERLRRDGHLLGIPAAALLGFGESD